MNIKRKYIIIAAVAVGIISSGLIISKIKNRVHYQTKAIKECTITQVVEASGTINPVNTVSVGSTVSGLIKAIYVDYNSQVKKGQLLAQIDPANFEATVQQNKAQINSAQANLARMEAVTEMSRKTYVRYKNLYQKNFIAKSELDQAESDYLSNLAQVGAAKAQISQAQATYKTAMTNLGYTKIIAPVDGTIISDLTKMQIEVSVSEADIGKVQEGQDVTYTLDGYPDSVFYGKVTQVRISPTTVSNVVTYSVIVGVDNKDLTLKPGMTANVSIITDKSENVLCAPSIALKYTPETDGKKYKTQGLWILDKKKPKRVNIEVGASDDTHIEVISEDIKSGDRVIVGASNQAKKEKNTRRRGPGMF